MEIPSEYSKFPAIVEIEAQIKEHNKQISILVRRAEELMDSYELNVYETEDDAYGTLESAHWTRAKDGCEGSYNVGPDEIVTECLIGGVKYLGTSTFEYNRHDKEFYYPEEHELVFTKVEEQKVEISENISLQEPPNRV